MISEATVMTKWSSLTMPSAFAPRPITILRSARSFMSSQRFHITCLGSIPSALPCWIWLSRRAASRLLAEVMAWKSPVKCRFKSSMGTTCAYPPPAAPPLIPKQGPKDGSRRAMMALFFMRPNASPRPTVVVVLPSPAGVGLMAVTSTSFPSGLSFTLSHSLSVSLALYLPYSSRSSSEIP